MSALSISAQNAAKLATLKAHRLPAGQYAITGSGPLGIRNLRDIGDIDIIVSAELWSALAAKYGVTNQGGVEKIV